MIQNPSGMSQIDLHYQIPLFASLPEPVQSKLADRINRRREQEYYLVSGVDTYFLKFVPTQKIISQAALEGFRLRCCKQYAYPIRLKSRFMNQLLRWVGNIIPMGHIVVFERP